ncbi:19567_t:CDS:2, partial [Dentiscutata erythropus]
MSDTLRLTCLVNGDPKKKVFEVEIEKRVNVPIGDNSMEADVLENKAETGVKELSSPIKKIRDVFTDNIADETIHIVVERPSVHDVSAKVLDAFNKRPKVTLPDVNELANFLEMPIPENMKIPLLQREYDSFLIQSMKNTCTSEDLNILFRVSETERAYEFITTIIGGLIRNDPPSREGTERLYLSFWDTNIRFPLELLISDGISIRNSSQHSSSFSKRPNYGFIVNHICLFRGEEKSPTSYEDAKAKLKDKLYWTYDPAPYILGYYANGPDITFVAICRPLSGYNPDVLDIVKSNLNQRRDRILNLRRMINLSILIKSLQDVIGWRETPEFQRIY